MDHIESDPPEADDPVYLRACREGLVAFLGWLVAGAVTLTVSLTLGYDVDPAEMPLVLGIPLWVLLGVVVPWIAAIGFGVWYSLGYVRDQDLGSEPEGDADG
jgi:hypothetical protein